MVKGRGDLMSRLSLYYLEGLILRKYNSKQTKENIIIVSTELFIDKGYEKTTMQDIIDSLGMSKGAVFHHFNSKNEILNAVIAKHTAELTEIAHTIVNDINEELASEKIKSLINEMHNNPQVNLVARVLASQADNQKMVLLGMQEIIIKVKPIITEQLRQGLNDGSITTDYPDECAQILLLLLNIWCNPVLFKCDEHELQRRISFMQQLMKQIGVDVIHQ